jgi:CheY-like chemotaxis protein
MFNILIVDDEPETSYQVKALINEEIPEAQVETAATVEEGRQALMGAHRADRPFDAVILDFKLPETAGENPEVDVSLCREIELLMRNALVIHITAFKEDPFIIQHLEEVHETKFGNKAIRLWKLDTKIAEQLLDKLKPELYGQHVLQQIKNLFNLEAPAKSSTKKRQRYARGFRTGRSRTHELGTVTRQIAACWDNLDEEVQGKVQEIFSVKRSGKDVTVSLFRSSPSSTAKE